MMTPIGPEEHDHLHRILYAARERMPQFVVYDHPGDDPDRYVARLWLALPGPPVMTNITVRCVELDPLREIMEACGLVCLTRSPEDAPAILETWL